VSNALITNPQNYTFTNNMGSKVYLLYHSFTCDNDHHPRSAFHKNKYTIDIKNFEEQIALSYNKNAIYSFDDGHVSLYELAFPLIDKYKVKSIAFISTKYIGQEHWLSASNIKELFKHGIDIGSHGVNHIRFTNISDCQVKKELINSKAYLEDLLGTPVNNFSFVGGFYDLRSIRIAKEVGYRYLYCSEPGIGINKKGLIRRVCILSKTNTMQFKKIIQEKIGIKNLLRYHMLYHFRTLKERILY